jgi:transcriptional regulator with XRE-family HTH domain
MISDTLSKGLENYRIGPKIRALRLERGLGQTQLSEHTGLSPALLSKIERGQLFPTLPTLLRIAMVFSVGLDHFFVEGEELPAISVTRKKDRVRLPDRKDVDSPAYVFESLDFPLNDRKMDAYYAEFPTQFKSSEPHRHKGSEFIYLLKGQLKVEVAGVSTVLEDGDAMHFDSNALHSYCCQGRSAASAIVVVSPY